MVETMEYKPEFGEVKYPQGFAGLLEGLAVEEQMGYFRMGNGLYLKDPFPDRRKSPYNAARKLHEDNAVLAVILREGKIAGVWVYDEEASQERACLVETGYCCRFDQEPDGSGIKTFVLRSYLICVPEDFE